MLLEQRLGKIIEQFEKPCCILNQNTPIPEDLIQRFNIIPRKVKYNSVAGNLITGYAATTAAKDKKHALFVASDSPLTSKEFIETFVQLVEKNQDNAALIFPAVLIGGKKDKFGRHPLKLLNDTDYQLPGLRFGTGARRPVAGGAAA